MRFASAEEDEILWRCIASISAAGAGRGGDRRGKGDKYAITQHLKLVAQILVGLIRALVRNISRVYAHYMFDLSKYVIFFAQTGHIAFFSPLILLLAIIAKLKAINKLNSAKIIIYLCSVL